MTRVCCPGCRLRFSPAAAATLPSCPECGEELHTVTWARETLGYELYDPAEATALRQAVEAALRGESGIPPAPEHS